MLSTLQRLFFWNYARSSWQWDILCVVILIFIFLTPKGWFQNSERQAQLTHQSPTAQTLVVGAEIVERARDKNELEQRLKTFTGRADLKVIGMHKVVGQDGKTTGYEIDIR